MKTEKLKKQINQLSKYVPKHISLITEQKDRELTADEFQVIKGYLEFYGVNRWIKQRGMVIKHISKDSFLDFAFINVKDNKGRFCIYLNLK
jgi:hypothetical protein